MPAIDLSVLCIPAECDNIKLPIECEIASRWDAYLLCDICRHFASVMLHFASLISHNLRCIPAYAHQIPTGFFQSLLNYHRDNLYIIYFFLWGCKKTSRAITAREAKKSLLQTFWCGIARSAQFHKFKLNVIACFTMKKHINHNAKLIHT